MSEQVFRNARIVLGDEVVQGSLAMRDGRIADIASGPVGGRARISAATS